MSLLNVALHLQTSRFLVLQKNESIIHEVRSGSLSERLITKIVMHGELKTLIKNHPKIKYSYNSALFGRKLLLLVCMTLGLRFHQATIGYHPGGAVYGTTNCLCDAS